MKVLVAGASGLVGFEVVKALKVRGHEVHTLSRDAGRAERLRPYAVKVQVRDATSPGALEGVAEGVEVVVSAIGAPVSMQASEKRAFADVDTVSNVALLAEAKRARVRRFVYLGVHSEPWYEQTAYVRSHAAVEAALRGSGLEWVVVKPTGIFGAFSDFVKMARTGRLPAIGGGSATSNPIHEIDVAEVLLRAAEGEVASQTCVDVGGPEVLTRRRIAELAYAAVGQTPRVVSVPAWAMSWVAAFVGVFNRRLGEFMKFVILASTHSAVAPKVGQRTLSEYFAQVAKG